MSIVVTGSAWVNVEVAQWRDLAQGQARHEQDARYVLDLDALGLTDAEVFVARYDLAAAGTQQIYLTGATLDEKNVVGSDLAFTIVHLLLAVADRDNDDAIRLAGDATNPWEPGVGGTDAHVDVHPEGPFLLFDPAGLAVNAGASRLLLTNLAGVPSSITLIMIGAR